MEGRSTTREESTQAVGRAQQFSCHVQVAGLHAQQGKFSPAEALYKQALEIYSDAFGAEHYLVAKELDALAVLYQKQGK